MKARRSRVTRVTRVAGRGQGQERTKKFRTRSPWKSTRKEPRSKPKGTTMRRSRRILNTPININTTGPRKEDGTTRR
eukprot:2037954-Heterocapsa_arctica.AAC.1